MLKRIELCHINKKENKKIKTFFVLFLKEVEENGEIVYHTIQQDIAIRSRNCIKHWSYGEKNPRKKITQKSFVKKMGKKMLALKSDTVILIYKEEDNVVELEKE